MLTLVRKRAAQAKGFTDQEISGGGLKVDHHLHPQRDGRGRAGGVEAQRPKGLKGLHVGGRLGRPEDRCAQGLLRRPGLPRRARSTRRRAPPDRPGSAFKPFALAAGIDDGYSLKSTFEGNSPYVYPNGRDKVVNEGPGDGNDYGSAIPLTTATEESVNTAFVDLTQAMDDGPKKIIDMAVKMGVPATAPGLEPVAGISLGSATISPVDMANSYGTIADGGKAKKWFVINKVTSSAGEVPLQGPEEGPSGCCPRTSTGDVSYALQQVVKKRHRHRTPWRSAGPAAGKTGTATNDDGNVSSSWFVGYTPQLATAVMYVRGDGNDNLNCEKQERQELRRPATSCRTSARSTPPGPGPT